jgi:hypothetical protein
MDLSNTAVQNKIIGQKEYISKSTMSIKRRRPCINRNVSRSRLLGRPPFSDA